MKYFINLLFLVTIAACGEGHAASASDSARTDSMARVRQDSINRTQPGYVVDSILPVEEQLHRFRAGLTDTLHGLTGGANSPDELVRSFVRKLEMADTAGLARLSVSRAEFAWLVYPESPNVAPPYQLAPDIVWMRTAAASSTGLSRLLARHGGSPLGFRSWSCASQPFVNGHNRIWRDCAVRFDGAPSGGLQLFSAIIERAGRYKILSYANAF